MPIQAPQWTDYLNCPVCCREFGASPRSPISLGCGHTLCKHCLKHLHRKQCPFDQTEINLKPDELVVNTALLQLAGYPPPPQPYHAPSIQALPDYDRKAYDCIIKCLEHLALYLKFCGIAPNSMPGTRLSRPMQRKLVILLQCAILDADGRGKAARAARSLGERTVTELILQHQNPQQLSANLWAAVRARGCQFLGPAMQEEVLKLVLLALEDGSALSRKVLVMFVVQRLEPHFPQASKTSIGHVVQLLYRASCFKVSKRECDSSLMQLKDEFRTYESLRREHDAQIVQIATEAGLRIAPDQWSALLYGDTTHKSHMQSIIDKLQTPQSFAQSIQELFIALQRTGDPADLVVMNIHLERLANIDASPDAQPPSWRQLAEMLISLREVVAALIHYLQQISNGRDSNHNKDRNNQNSPGTAASTPTHSRYRVALCRDAASRAFCPRGNACTFPHADDEQDRYIVNTANGNYILMPIPNQGMPPRMPPQGIPAMPVPAQGQYTAYMPQQPIENFNVPPPIVNMEVPEAPMNNGHPNNYPMMIINNEVMMPAIADHQYYRGYNAPVNMPYRPDMPQPQGFAPVANSNIQHQMYPVPPPDYMEEVYSSEGSGEIMADFRAPPPPYGNLSLDRHTDAVWAPKPGEQCFNFNDMRNAIQGIPASAAPARTISTLQNPIPGPSSAPDIMPNQHQGMYMGGNRQPRERMTGAFQFVGADDRELEAGLQALERQIDTEFKNAD